MRGAVGVSVGVGAGGARSGGVAHFLVRWHGLRWDRRGRRTRQHGGGITDGVGEAGTLSGEVGEAGGLSGEVADSQVR